MVQLGSWDQNPITIQVGDLEDGNANLHEEQKQMMDSDSFRKKLENRFPPIRMIEEKDHIDLSRIWRMISGKKSSSKDPEDR